jgi:hypothetical protein
MKLPAQIRTAVRRAWLAWRYRKIDPNLCCCGDWIGQGGSICGHGGCRSAKEYAISREMGAV